MTQTLAALLDGVVASSVAVDDLRVALEDAAGAAVEGVDPAQLPLRAPKDTITKVLACEQHLVATQGEWELAEPVVRGRVLDRLLHHRVHGDGSAPNESALAIAESAFEAERDDDVIEWLMVNADGRARLDEDATEFAGRLDTWLGRREDGSSAIDPGWWPRCESRIGVELAGGRMLCTAQLDLAVGGGATGRPLVIIEVKSGRFSQEHRDGLFWYALVGALRYATPPAAVIGWSAWDGVGWCQPVTGGVLEASTHRACAAFERLGALARGLPPTRTACRACTWCPERDTCAEAAVPDVDDDR